MLLVTSNGLQPSDGLHRELLASLDRGNGRSRLSGTLRFGPRLLLYTAIFRWRCAPLPLLFDVHVFYILLLHIVPLS